MLIVKECFHFNGTVIIIVDFMSISILTWWEWPEPDSISAGVTSRLTLWQWFRFVLFLVWPRCYYSWFPCTLISQFGVKEPFQPSQSCERRLSTAPPFTNSLLVGWEQTPVARYEKNAESHYNYCYYHLIDSQYYQRLFSADACESLVLTSSGISVQNWGNPSTYLLFLDHICDGCIQHLRDSVMQNKNGNNNKRKDLTAELH